MINKDEFIDIIYRLKNYNDMQNEIREVSKKYIEPKESDFNNAAEICIGHETVVAFLLKDMFHDDSDMISYWLWELDYGRKFKMGMVIDENGNKIDLSTPEKLYNYLTHENQK